jgi:hypothetical protein
MPMVPRQDRSVELSRLPSPRLGELPSSAPAEAFGGGEAGQALGKGLNKIADAAGKYQEQAAQRAHEVWATGADLTLSQKQADIEQAVKNMKGKDAAGSYEFAQKEWTKTAEEIRKSAANPLQQEAAEKLLQQRWTNLKKYANGHSDSEFSALDKLQNQEYVKATANEAMQNKEDPQRVGVALANQAAEIERYGRRQGWTDGIIKQKQLEENSATRMGVLNAYLDSQDPMKDSKAQAFFAANQGGFTELDKAKASKLLESATLTGESQRQADRIFASAADLSVALKQASALDGKLRDETTRRVKDLFAQKKLAEDTLAEQRMKEAGNIIDQTGNTDNIPRSTWESLSVSQKTSLESYAKHKREGTEPVTDWNQFYSLKTMAATPQLRNEFMRIDLMQYRSKLGNAEFKELINAQDGLRKGDDKTSKLLDGVLTDTQRMDAALRDAGYDPSPKEESDDWNTVTQFRRAYEARVIQLNSQQQKEATAEQKEAIISDLMAEGAVEKYRFKLFGVEQAYWPDRRKKKFELLPGEAMEVEYSDIPERERATIEKKLKERKIKPTEDRVLEIYRKKVGQ